MKLLLKYAISLTLLLPFVSGMSQNNYHPITDGCTWSVSNSLERIRHIELHNITGLCVLRHFLEPEEKDTFQLHVSCLPSGVYFLNCYGKRTCKTTKIVKL
ncbi:MAG: T9SS type A sorting domain-containing protein [Bacteroidales bacterium]|nr:T9SS type A sorting domain-containing protein [Bacteroidales bacterium]